MENSTTSQTTQQQNITSETLVLEKSSNSSGLQVDLHPLVIINISDHFTRTKVESGGSTSTRVIGVILGIQNGRNVEICNSFELVYTIVDGSMVLDFDYLKKKYEQFKKVFPTYDLLGWYSTGSKVSKDDINLHKQILELNESPLYLMLDTQAAFTQTVKDLPIVIYESELHIVNDQPTTLFVKAPYKIQTGESERIGVNHIAKVTPSGSEGSALTTHLFSMQNAISMLNIRVKILKQYLEQVKEKKLPFEHGILRQVASLCNTLPAINTDEFRNTFLQEYNDVLLVTYLATITKNSSILNDAIDKYLLSHEKQGKRRYFMEYSNKSSSTTTTTTTASSNKAIEDIYQKKTLLEHVLLRPDTYVGTTQKQEDDMWVLSNSVFDKKKKSVRTGSIENSKKNPLYIHPVRSKYVPGLLKIFDEILVNAADNKHRDPTMTEISVKIDPNSGTISIMNDGKGIPVAMHKTEGVYVVEMVMGHLMSGSNFNDNELKVVGGRNGFGAKLTNIFSKQFTVETVDKSSGLKYKQTWKNNMGTRENPIIEKIGSGEADFTKITFVPDLEKFKIESLWDDDILQLMERRVYDIAGCLPGVNVYFNDQKLDLDFQSYVKLYEHHLSAGSTGEKVQQDQQSSKEENEEAFKEEKIIFGTIGDRWKIGVGTSDTGQFTQVSFVNSINTLKGGTHVNFIADQVVRYVAEKIKKKHSDLEVRPMNIKHHLSLFVSCLIENPSFDSQTKETLTTKPIHFGSTPEVPEQLLAQFVKTSKIVEKVAGWVMMKHKADLIHSTSTRTSKTSLIKSIPKLDDANWAGGPRSQECTLIITEGDSAKSLALSGLSVLGRSAYGVFPLRGKLLNVRDVTPKQLLSNEEITHLTNILGLSHTKKYEDDQSFSELRYGRVLLMTDQDYDGSHIKGLFINFIQYFWPALLKRGFIQEFVTPIIKVSKGSTKKSFFTINDYQAWRQTLPSEQVRQWNIKYYKGLGTNTSAEAKDYFSNLQEHVIDFKWTPDTDDLVAMAFAKNLVERRSEWVKTCDLSESVDHSIKELNYRDFINKELIHYSWAANHRSIPSVIDGLKPGQRKILFACFKRRLTNEIKVAQLSGYVAEHTAYHHGEVSLNSTIVKMAQNFVGSNNIALLSQGGQFGTRLQGGSDSASARYIFTKLEPITRQIFNELDDPILNYLEEEGESIQPDHYAPIIPMVLVNGSEGIGMGMSTSVPLYSPIDLIDQLLLRLSNQKPIKHLVPWYRGFKGTVVGQPNGGYKTSGVINFEGRNLVISDLPIGKWTASYKEILNSLIDTDVIKSYQENNTENTVSFTILVSNVQLEQLEEMSENELIKLFKLTSVVNLNLVLFDGQGKIKKYSDVYEIINDFYQVRMDMYIKRREYIINTLREQTEKLQITIRFLTILSSGKLEISGKNKSDIIETLETKFEFGHQKDEIYNYLFSLPILDITKEKIQNLQSSLHKKLEELEAITNLTPSDLWISDLKQLRSSLLKYDRSLEREQKNQSKSSTPKSKPKKLVHQKYMALEDIED
eukprot:gene7475-9185_t